jgi:hypothetical protein
MQVGKWYFGGYDGVLNHRREEVEASFLKITKIYDDKFGQKRVEFIALIVGLDSYRYSSGSMLYKIFPYAGSKKKEVDVFHYRGTIQYVFRDPDKFVWK